MNKIYPDPNIADNLQQIWLDSGKNQSQLGHIVGVDRRTMGSYINGYSDIGATRLKWLCQEFHLSADKILGLEV